jgi:uncharacterized RDD family membrane protein YckC
MVFKVKAPIGKRIIAYIIDCVLVAVIAGIFFGIGFTLPLVLRNAIVGILGLLIALLGFVLALVYMLLRDGLFGGRSLGKKLMKLRVVRSDGSKCDFVSSALRNITLPVFSIIPPLYLIELLLPLVDKEGLRLGDRVAKTQVVE